MIMPLKKAQSRPSLHWLWRAYSVSYEAVSANAYLGLFDRHDREFFKTLAEI